jgi:hypothetical protein
LEEVGLDPKDKPLEVSIGSLLKPTIPARCTHVSGCSLFAMFRLESSGEVWKTLYCDGSFKRCARFKAATEGRSIPINLLPNGKMMDLPESGRES